jgi:glycosyltransferase involved in cell wall biosynthesis
VGAYVLGLVDRLPALAPEDRFYFFSASFRERYARRDWPSNVTLVDRRLPVQALNLAWNRLGWPPIDRLVKAPLDLVHSPHPLLIPARSARRVVTVHDLFFLKHPEMTTAEIRRDYADLAREHVRGADGVLCVSEHTAAETRRLLDVSPDRIAVTPLGVDPGFREPPPEAEVEATLNRLRLPRGAVLYVGSDERRKNLVSLVMAYLSLARRRDAVPPLVLAGPGSSWAQGGDRVGPQIRATDYLPREDVRVLMAASALLVLPSLEEGFGLPVAEAMAAGLPVVCSRGSALEEVAGDAATLVDPTDVNGLSQAIERLLDDPAEAEAHRRRGLERSRRFDWQDTAERTIAFYRTVLGR